MERIADEVHGRAKLVFWVELSSIANLCGEFSGLLLKNGFALLKIVGRRTLREADLGGLQRSAGTYD